MHIRKSYSRLQYTKLTKIAEFNKKAAFKTAKILHAGLYQYRYDNLLSQVSGLWLDL